MNINIIDALGIGAIILEWLGIIAIILLIAYLIFD